MPISLRTEFQDVVGNAVAASSAVGRIIMIAEMEAERAFVIPPRYERLYQAHDLLLAGKYLAQYIHFGSETYIEKVQSHILAAVQADVVENQLAIACRDGWWPERG